MDDFVTSRVCVCSPQDYWYHRIMVVVYYFAQIYNCGMLVLLPRTIFICICACTDSHLIPQMCGAGSGHSFSKGHSQHYSNTAYQHTNVARTGLQFPCCATCRGIYCIAQARRLHKDQQTRNQTGLPCLNLHRSKKHG